MKKITTLQKARIMIVFLASLISCKNNDKVPDININPAFEMAPPIAQDVKIQKIEGDDQNILLIAQFTKEEIKAKLREPFLAIDNDGEKIVLRDDGKGFDKVAGDGIFTVKLKADVNEFEKLVTDNKMMQGRKRLIFKGRSIVSDSLVRPFNIETFKARKDFTSIRDIFAIAPPELKDHSLMITDLNVVEDANRTWNPCAQTGNVNGAWTFKTIMKHLASTNPGTLVNDIQLSDFVENWLSTWLTPQTINGETVNARLNMNSVIITNWKNRSQTLPLPRVPVGKLDMRAAPFKLLAIVNRLDLRGNSGYGFSNAGEGRFVFCVMNGCSPTQFNIIFEYGVPKRSCANVKAYAQQWYNLKDLAFTDPAFNTQLETITDQFAKCGTSPSKPNQSSLNQLRTNEIQLASPWELREFVLDNGTHLFKETTVKQEPAAKYNTKLNNADVQRLAQFINTMEPSILANNYTVPDVFSSNPFLGGHALTQFPPVGLVATNPHHWNGTAAAGPSFINSNDARQVFSLNTCSGCHGGETQTSFTMIDPVPFGTQATLAGFLTGTPGIPVAGRFPQDLDGANGIMNVPDPAGRASDNNKRKFNDLQRRADDLEALVNSTCRSIIRIRDILTKDPLRFTH